MSDQSAPPPVPPAAAGTTTSDDKLWIIFCHLSLLFGVGFLFPLIVYLVKRSDAPLTAEHAREALNFHISIYLYLFVSFALMFVVIGFLTIFAVLIMGLIFPIVACLKASEGQFYRYPLTIRLI